MDTTFRMIERSEMLKRARRLLDGNYSPRKVIVVTLFVFVLLLYSGPYIFRLLFSSTSLSLLTESASHSIASRLSHFKASLSSLDAHVLYTHTPAPTEAAVQLAQSDSDEDIHVLPSQHFLPYVGNGYVGLCVQDNIVQTGSSVSVASGSALHIKEGRSLTLPVPYEPLLAVTVDGGILHEALMTHYLTGTVHRIQSWELPSLADNYPHPAEEGASPPPKDVDGLVEVTQRVYAHRTLPWLLVQDVVVINPNPVSVYVRLNRAGAQRWSPVTTDTFSVSLPGGVVQKYTVTSGTVSKPDHSHRHPTGSTAVTVAAMDVPALIQVLPRQSFTLHVLTAVNYSDVTQQSDLQRLVDLGRKTVQEAIQSVVSTPGSASRLSSSHGVAWGALWRSGLHLSTSRAAAALNGDLINATIYDVLSQVRAPLQEPATSPATWQAVAAQLSPTASDGCYRGHHTLQAEKLWSHLSTVDDVARVVAAWLITLEKQGCHELLKAGADGALQAMLLSLGGLCFRNQHLEYNTQAVDLHRDVTFRRLRYGAGVYLNLSVEVQDHDYKPVMWLSLEQRQLLSLSQERTRQQPDDSGGDAASFVNPSYMRMSTETVMPVSSSRSGKVVNSSLQYINTSDNFYACDAGCLDPPVQLGLQQQQFPVKKTEPETAVLYITSDRQHMEDLKHSIHVREVAIAPGHHQSVIALHRHGHKWGRLPPLFWLTIAALIVTFHLFLFKLVVNEYCSADARTRYRKLSDF